MKVLCPTNHYREGSCNCGPEVWGKKGRVHELEESV